MNDSELQNLMFEIQEHRKLDRDFTSLEDQIRCLKKRFYNLEVTEADDEEQMKQKVIDQGRVIENLREELQVVRHHIQTTKRTGTSLQEKSVRLHHQEGERNAELALLRGDTTKQLAINQDFEAEIERVRH